MTELEATIPNPLIAAMWHIMLAYGGALKSDGNSNLEYYSGSLKIDRELTLLAYEDVKATGLYYDRMSEPTDRTEGAFNGTGYDNIQVHYLHGTLISGSGKQYHWGTIFKDMGLAKMIKLMLNAPTFEAARQKFEDRVTTPYASIKCTCEIKESYEA